MNLDFSKTTVLVIGDFMIDHYIIGKSNRMSPEAPVPVIIPTKKYSVPGGAGNVALNLCAMEAMVSCIGVVGNDRWGDIYSGYYSTKVPDSQIDTSSIIISDLCHTTVKHRTYLEKKQILRVDEEEKLDYSHNKKINDSVSTILKNSDIVILSDYNKGVLNDNTINHILNNAKEHNVPVIVDPKKEDFSIYKGANILTPNLNELKRASQITISDDDSIVLACNSLIKKNGFEYIVTTKGDKGMTIVGENFVKHIEAYSIENPDVTGAGDTVVSALALAFSNTQDLEISVNFANIAAANVVSKSGTTCTSIAELESRIKANKKIFNHE